MRIFFSRATMLWLGLALGLTSCFELVEEIEVRADKSGTVTYRVVTGEKTSLLENMTGMLQLSLDDALHQEAEKLVGALKAQPGLSNIRYKISGTLTGSTLQFDFNHPRSLNKALYQLSGSKKTLFSPGYFKIGWCGFKRINFAPWLRRYLEQENIDLPPDYLTDLVIFKTVVRVPSNIRRVKPSGKVNKSDKREATARYLLTDVLNDDVNTGLKIRY